MHSRNWEMLRFHTLWCHSMLRIYYYIGFLFLFNNLSNFNDWMKFILFFNWIDNNNRFWWAHSTVKKLEIKMKKKSMQNAYVMVNFSFHHLLFAHSLESSFSFHECSPSLNHITQNTPLVFIIYICEQNAER